MKISVVIPAHNEEQFIGECLENILRYRPQELLEVIVVNNASTDKTESVARTFSGVRVVKETKKGTGWARQRGLDEARGDLVAYLDADTHVSPHWFSSIKEEFSRREDLICLSGPYRYYDLPRFQKFLSELGWKLFAPITYRLVGYMVLGGNFVAKRKALIAAGGFDVKIQFYGDDTNIAWRLSKIGKVVFKMDFFVYASGRRLLHGGLARVYFIYGINFLWGVLFHKPFTKKSLEVR